MGPSSPRTLLLLLLCFASVASAQTTASEQSNEKFKVSFTERFRIETYDNTVTLSKAAKAGVAFVRNRMTLMGQWFPAQSLEVGAKITNEFRNYFAPSTNDFFMNEVFIDQLYVKWNTTAVLDGALTVGRQNIMLGEGFVVMDGNPLDGSRSTYFNAVRYDWSAAPKHVLTLFYTYQPRIDQLPVLNGNDIDPAFRSDGTWKLIEQTEAGGGVYYTGTVSGINLQSYYLRKEYLEPDAKLGQLRCGVNTVGSRLNIPLSAQFSTTIEGAYQFGAVGVRTTKAYGGYLYVEYVPQWETTILPKKMTLGSIALSGDDRSTTDYEGWDPIFSRWPKWSESFIYTQVKEFNGRPAYWSNLTSLYASVQFILDPQFGVNIDYHHLTAPQAVGPTAFPGGSGTVRGDLFIAKALLTMSKTITGQVILEHFKPGNYYFDNANAANWMRVELLFRI